jgi:hypothetical protein
MAYESAIVKLAEVIVGVGGQATIPFSSIDQKYRSLHIDFTGRCDASAVNEGLSIQFNGDTGSNYDSVGMQGYTTNNVGGIQTLAQASLSGPPVAAATAGAGIAGWAQIDIPNYVGTTFQKICFVRGGYGAGAQNMQVLNGTWRSTAAITSILLFPASGNFVQNSVASLYGVV